MICGEDFGGGRQRRWKPVASNTTSVLKHGTRFEDFCQFGLQVPSKEVYTRNPQ
jgi:hypothetical protein